MKSGIYLLKFTYSGEEYTYVGKSVDIDTRLQQHHTSFIKRKAAKKLQNLFELCGEPDVYILQECHPDHIDVLEAHYIDFYRGPFSLNTIDMPNPFRLICPNERSEYLYKSLDYLIFNTVMLERKDANSLEVIQTLNEEVAELERKRSIEELEEDISNRVAATEASRAEVLLKLFALQDKLAIYNTKPWYYRIFHKPL